MNMLTVFRLRSQPPECEAKQWGQNLNWNFHRQQKRNAMISRFQDFEVIWTLELWILMFVRPFIGIRIVFSFWLGQQIHLIVDKGRLWFQFNSSASSHSHGQLPTQAWERMPLLIRGHSIVCPSSTCHLTHLSHRHYNLMTSTFPDLSGNFPYNSQSRCEC